MLKSFFPMSDKENKNCFFSETFFPEEGHLETQNAVLTNWEDDF